MDISKVITYAGIGLATIATGVGIYILVKKNKEKKAAEKAAAEEKIRKVTGYTEGADRYNTCTVVTDDHQIQNIIDMNFSEKSTMTNKPAISPLNGEIDMTTLEEDSSDLEMEIPPENNYDFPSSEPFQIDYQTFDQTCRNFDKIEVTYYDGDGEFVADINGHEETVDFPDDSFGPHVLNLFMDEGGIRRKRKVWIRNPSERTDYEITFNTDSYNCQTYDIPGGVE